MVLEIGIYLGELKDMVCFLSGMTIEVVVMLEEKGLRIVIILVMKCCM